MKAIVQTSYGPDGLRLQEIATPAPKANEVLVHVHASSVNAMDWRPLTFPPAVQRLLGAVFGRPDRPSCGGDLAGIVKNVGTAVTQFKPGDAVFGAKMGSFAEYVCVPEDRLVPKPAGISFEQAAAVPVAGLTALQSLRAAGVGAGKKVLINGAGGGVGGFAVQIAKALGAEVTAVCSPRNQDIARSNGADHVIDYTREDFAWNRQRYDAIVAVNGGKSVLEYRRALAPDGVFVVCGGSMRQGLQTLFFGPLLSLVGRRKFRGVFTRSNQADLRLLGEMLEKKQIAPVIDRRYPFADVPDAIRYLIAGHSTGKVVITLPAI